MTTSSTAYQNGGPSSIRGGLSIPPLSGGGGGVGGKSGIGGDVTGVDPRRVSPSAMGPPLFPQSFPPPNVFFAGDSHPPGPPLPVAPGPSGSSYGNYAPDGSDARSRPTFSLSLPVPHFQPDNLGPFSMPMNYMGQAHPHLPAVVSPYQVTPGGHMIQDGGLSAGSDGAMTDYFPPYAGPSSTQGQGQGAIVSPPWGTNAPVLAMAAPARPAASARSQSTGGNGAKTSRQQFTACGACRHRRVKCDLKEKQEAWDKAAKDGIEPSTGPTRNNSKKKKAICTNCEERGTNCIDEYAPLKAAKQLRRGKRISEIEMLYGKAGAGMAAKVEHIETSLSPKGKGRDPIPELTKEFFDSPFFRRFQVQRPILDPKDFIGRYLSSPAPNAASMGREGAILVHVIYAWAVSYGVNEWGQLDVMEGGSVPSVPLPLIGQGEHEGQREADRQARFNKLKGVIELILDEIDEYGVMRKPTWDGVRCLLLVLPLTENISSPVERQGMYETALSQVYTLCSFGATGYDGQPSGASGVNGGTDMVGDMEITGIRVRIYWYTFVHEGITSGLKGGRLHLDDEDIDTIQDSIHNRSLLINHNTYRSLAKFATAPINLALACRQINKALTGPSAKRRRAVNGEAVKEAWEALERCWEEFESLKFADSTGVYGNREDVIRFADGWKIFLFEAQNVIRNNLEERLNKLTGQAFITDPSGQTSQHDIIHLQHLLEISKSKCDVQTQQIMDIVKLHVGSRFFEWDASLVRDGTYYAAMLLAREGGSEEDISICLQALNELRWCHAKAWDRSADLRREWSQSPKSISPDHLNTSWSASDSSQHSQNPFLPPIIIPHDAFNTTPPMGSSAYTSPSLISPATFENPNNNGALRSYASSAQSIMPNEHSHSHLPIQHSGQQTMSIGHDTIHVKQEWEARIDHSAMASGSSYAVYGTIPGPPPLQGSNGGADDHQGGVGQYMMQQDVTQAYVNMNNQYSE